MYSWAFELQNELKIAKKKIIIKATEIRDRKLDTNDEQAKRKKQTEKLFQEYNQNKNSSRSAKQPKRNMKCIYKEEKKTETQMENRKKKRTGDPDNEEQWIKTIVHVLNDGFSQGKSIKPPSKQVKKSYIFQMNADK